MPALTWQLDRSTFDPTADPCTDFYQYVCGGFVAHAEIPADRDALYWQRDAAIAGDDRTLHDILTGGGAPAGGSDDNDRELGRLRTFYASCMAAAEPAGDRTAATTLAAALDRIDHIRTRGDVARELRALQTLGVQALIHYDGEPDPADRTRYRGELDHGDFGLRRMYAATNPEAEARRQSYLGHIAKMLELAGTPAARATADSRAVFDLEGTLARVTLADDKANAGMAGANHPMTLAQLTKLAPHLEPASLFQLVGQPADRPLNVVAPDYVQAVEHALATRPIDALRAYLRWQLLLALGPALARPLADEVARYAATSGEQPAPRDRVCRLETLKALGVELSRQYVRRALPAADRDQARTDAAAVQAEMVVAARTTPWLSPAARAATASKLDGLLLKIGYPTQWPDAPTDVALAPDTFLDNVIGSRKHEQARAWRRATAARSREAWDNIVYPNEASGMAAARLVIPNGFPDVFTNSILFTAAFLRPPLYDARAPVEVRYGGFGAIVGHELVHVLDNHEIDGSGELHDWWTADDQMAGLAQYACVIRQAGAYRQDGAALDGERTLYENNADLGG